MSTRRQQTDRVLLWIRAVRLPFLGASVLPFLAGAAMADPDPLAGRSFCAGLLVIVGVHLCANLANDVVDTDSGADAADPVRYGLFGGSKVMSAGLLSRDVVVCGAWLAGILSFCALAALAHLRTSLLPFWVAIPALSLALAYSVPPFRLVCRGWGEAVVALLFGPVAVMAGHYVRSGVAWTPGSLRLGLVAGLLTMAVLIANEVPDAADDACFGKRTMVVRLGTHRAWLLYAGVVGLALGLAWGLRRPGRTWNMAAAIVAGLLPAAGAAARLRRHSAGKPLLRAASMRAMLAQSGMLMVILLDLSL